jgi:hypothetical protein
MDSNTKDNIIARHGVSQRPGVSNAFEVKNNISSYGAINSYK